MCLLQNWQFAWFQCLVFFLHSMWWGDKLVELWLLTLDLLRYQGVELCSFRALLFCFVFDCGIGCMNLFLLLKVWLLFGCFSQSLSFTRLTARCFFLLFNYFSCIFPYPGTLDSIGVFLAFRHYASTHVFFFSCLPKEMFYSVVMYLFYDIESDTWDLPRNLSQSVNCDFTSLCWTKKIRY